MASFTLTGIKRPLDAPKDGDLRPVGLWLGTDKSLPLEVAAYEARGTPGESAMRKAWNARLNGRPTPVLVVVEHPNADGKPVASLVGPSGDEPDHVQSVALDRARQVCQAALAQPSRHAAILFLQATLPDLASPVPGIRNEGFLATHELHDGVPKRGDWATATKRGGTAVGKRGRDLVRTLGYNLEEAGRVWFLKASAKKSAVAVFLDQNEVPEQAIQRFENMSPVSYAIHRADQENVPYVILTTPSSIRIYPTKIGVGVGQRGRTETYVEAQLDVLTPGDAGYLWLIFSADAVKEKGTLEDILDKSTDYRASLGARLRGRVYEDVVPWLATSLAQARKIRKPTAAQLDETFQMALLLLFRLLFVAYAEDKELLPLRRNPQYRRRSLKEKAKELVGQASRDAQPGQAAASDTSTTVWEEVWHVFRAVDQGNPAWGVPAYNGGLFSSDPKDAPIGALLEKVKIPDAEYTPILFKLLVDKDDDGELGPVDFRSLGVREFGTIYEGLLESELSLAETDLTVDNKTGAYRPPKKGEEVVVEEGQYYLASTSGTRKATGSYFTKEFAVEHLLNSALEPALDEHLARLDKLDDAKAAEAFFDFRVADISMGSGHFLVAAVDHIEKRLTGYIAKRQLPGVIEELARLRKSAHDNLGDLAAGTEIEDALLLRRQIARRCIYGVDLKEGAVELARVSLWIHTFVPGLPLSLLDQHLVRGNSLVGIATADEAERLIVSKEKAEKATKSKAQQSLFTTSAKDVMRQVGDSMAKVARLGDATMAEIRQAKKEWEAATEAARPWKVLMDVLAASRLDDALQDAVPQIFEEWRDKPKSILDSKVHKRAREVLGSLEPCHFPVKFPEVFWRKERPGFDVLVGNPPWDKVRHEAQSFWVIRYPGLNALAAEDREPRIGELRRERPFDAAEEAAEQEMRETLQAYFGGAFQFQGSVGHYEYAQLFVERAYQLIADAGTLGYVLPRQCLVLGGWADLRRKHLVSGRVNVVQARNAGGWLFDDIHHSYMVVFLTQVRNRETTVKVWPASTSRRQFGSLGLMVPVTFTRQSLEELSDGMVVPWFNRSEDSLVFNKLKAAPRLSSGQGWISGKHDARWDFRSTGPHAHLLAEKPAKGDWKVMQTRHLHAYNIEAEGVFQKFAHPEDLAKVGMGVEGKAGSIHLAESHPRLILRHPSRNDDSRTLIGSMLPDAGLLYCKGYVHAVQHTDTATQAQVLALLGHLNSVVADWWARRFVDRHITSPVVNNLVLPTWDDATIRKASSMAGELVRRHGISRIAGGYDIPKQAELGELSDVQLLARLDALAAEGFGLSWPEVAVILEDFSEGGYSSDQRKELERVMRGK